MLAMQFVFCCHGDVGDGIGFSFSRQRSEIVYEWFLFSRCHLTRSLRKISERSGRLPKAGRHLVREALQDVMERR